MILRDVGKVRSDTENAADTFNAFFVNIGSTLKICKDKKWFLVKTNDVFDPVLKAVKKYSAHPSILSIKEKLNNDLSQHSQRILSSRQIKIMSIFYQFYLAKL